MSYLSVSTLETSSRTEPDSSLRSLGSSSLESGSLLRAAFSLCRFSTMDSNALIRSCDSEYLNDNSGSDWLFFKSS